MRDLVEKASEIVNEIRWLRAQQCVRCGLSYRNSSGTHDWRGWWVFRRPQCEYDPVGWKADLEWSAPGELVDPATPDDLRAAVVPLLDLEAAAVRYYEGDEIRPKPPYWSDCTDAMKDWYRHESKRVVYAALGLGEES